MNNIEKNIQVLREQLGQCKLLVVTKKRSTQKIREVIQAGVKLIGENKLQEIEDKYDQSLLSDLKTHGVKLHFIGHLQSNKVNKVVQLCDSIQSVDSLKLAKKINQAAERAGKIMPIFLELNLTGEEQKHGIPVETRHASSLRDASSLRETITVINSMPNIALQGFMCMGKFEDEKATRQSFRLCRELADQFNLPDVSMGMSDDYQIAIEEGSTMVRVGSIIFK